MSVRRYRPIHGEESAVPEPERHRLEFVSSPDSAALSEILGALTQLLRDQAATHQEIVTYIAENRGAMARQQIPVPHVQIEAARAPNVDVQVEPPPPADVQVNLPDPNVTIVPADWEAVDVEIIRDRDGLIERMRMRRIR